MPSYQFDGIEELERKPEIEAAGVELEIPGNRFLIVRAATDANPQWRANGRKIVNELNRLRNAEAGAERIREFLARKYADYLIIGWRGVTTRGVEIDYHPDVGFEFLMRAFDVYQIIDAFVWDTKNFRAERAKAAVEEVKNS